ncbi:MAG: hypothetical protein KAG53_09055 [Endozoicomonadaceae bacterium]|nr:hypothetical protein [Endozoicomonadaceae bacterium]
MLNSEHSTSVEMNVMFSNNHLLSNEASKNDTFSSDNDNESLSFMPWKGGMQTTNESPICKRKIDAQKRITSTSNPELHASSSLAQFHKFSTDKNIVRIRSEEIHSSAGASQDIQVFTEATGAEATAHLVEREASQDIQVCTETTDTEATALLVEREASQDIQVTHKKEIHSLVREELDEFITDMFFAFSKLNNNLIGPITCTEVASGFFAYIFSALNLSSIVHDNHDSPQAWLSFMTAGLASSAMYADAVLTVVKDPVKLKDKIREFKKLSKAEQVKIAVPMSIVCIASLYSPLHDAFNARDGVITLFGGDVTNPSTLYQVIGVVGGLCNWGAESLLPMILGLRLLSRIKSDVNQLLFADRGYHKMVENAVQQFTALVELYNKSIDLNGNPNELILDVNSSEIITYKALLDQLSSKPEFLENVISVIHGETLVSYPIRTRILAGMSIGVKLAVVMSISGWAESVTTLPFLLRTLKIPEKVDCAALRTQLTNIDINFPLNMLRQHAYTVQGIAGMENIYQMDNGTQCIYYAIAQKVRNFNNSVNQGLTTNGFRRCVNITSINHWIKFGAVGLATLGGVSYATMLIRAINVSGVNYLIEATQCPNVTIPSVSADMRTDPWDTTLLLLAIGYISLMMLCGAMKAWARGADRLHSTTNKGTKVITLTEHEEHEHTRRQLAIAGQREA